jgi:adenine-specific DNA methylase
MPEQLVLPVSAPAPRMPAARRAFRPIQYLGCKLRALEAIVDRVARIKPRPKRVLDLFAGTSVVAQGFAFAGFRVVATDAMAFSAAFCRALLGVGRPEAHAGADEMIDRLPTIDDDGPYADWIDRERRALQNGDADELLRITQTVPQIWRRKGATPALRTLFKDPCAALAATHYGGAYFGIGQAVEIDRIRNAIENANGWERDVLLTALLSAASECAFSPGKHFAQPHRIREDKDLSFLRQRVLKDRAIDVRSLFEERLARILDVAAPARENHAATRATLAEVLQNPGPTSDVQLIYADPPYTAQQYSRFYHVLETLTEYRVPRLLRRAGRVTAGLYPAERYLSPFCSKQKAPQAFRDLMFLSRMLGSHLLLSYSASASGRTGNDRVIALDKLLQLCRREFGRSVEVVELDHEYRQFNARGAAVDGRQDRELLIFCERRC